MDDNDDIILIEGMLNERWQDDVKYQLRRRVGDTVLDVLVRQHKDLTGSISVDFTRAWPTMDNPAIEVFSMIAAPDELVLIARMALDAWEHMMSLEEAKAELEQAG